MCSDARLPGPIRAVLFDLDGVLVETFDTWMAVVEACRLRLGHTPLGREAILGAWGQGLDADCRMFFPGLSPAGLAQEYEAEFGRHLDLVRPIYGAPRLLSALRAARVRRAVVTNSPAKLAHDMLRAVGLVESIELVVGGDEVPVGKPDPAMLRRALTLLAVPAGHAVMVGDTANDMEAARAAGVFSIGYRIRGDARVEHLAEVPLLLGLGSADSPDGSHLVP